MNRFADFFFKAQGVRWKVYGFSSAVAFIYALINLLVLHREEQSVGIESVVVLFALISLSVGVYVAQVKGFDEEKASAPKIFGSRLVTACALATAFVALGYYAGIPRMQAAIIDLRLELLTSRLPVYAAYRPPDQQLQTHVQTINSIVETSSRNQIPVDPNLLAKTETVLSNELRAPTLSANTKQAGWTASIDLQSLLYTRMAQTGAISTITPREIFKGPAYFFTSVVSIDDNTLYIKGEHSVFTIGGYGFVIKQSTVVFDSIDFVGAVSQSVITVIDDRSTVLVRDSIMKDVTQDLDRITWVDVRFENSRVLYRGGPLRLRNVTFKDCDLSNLELGLGMVLRNPELVASITRLSGKPITFTYEP